MNKFILSMVVLLSAFAPQACAQRNVVFDYNYRKAVEALYDDDDESRALDLINEQIEATPNHLDARFLRAKIYWREDKYDAALRDIRFAIQNYRGKPATYKSSFYGLLGAIYDDMDRYTDAVQAYKEAVKTARKDNPDRLQSYKFDLAQALYNNEDLESAERIYLEMLKDDPGDGAAMIGLARNRMDQEKYDDGLSWLNKAESYDASYSEIYRFKMQILSKQGKIDESIDAALKYYELDDDAPVVYVSSFMTKHFSYGIAKVKAEIRKDSSSTKWTALLIRMYEDHCDYRKAIELYDTVENEYGENKILSYRKSICYSELGQFSKAIKEITKAIELDGGNTFISSRGDIYRSAGMYDNAIADYSVSLEDDPTSGYEYYAIGWCHELQGDMDKALEFYNQGIDVDKTYPYLFLSRGDAFKDRGELDSARIDYEKVLEIDQEVEDGSCRHYALLGLGKENEAVEWINQIIEKYPNDCGVYYDKACLLARMGKPSEALIALKAAFEKGYRRFSHMEHDKDMDSLRNLEEYKRLISEYKGKVTEEIAESQEESDVTPEGVVSEVKMKKMAGGTYEVPCSINGLPLKFVFDTGASDVTISSVEANFMLKNDYLSEKDFRGTRKYLTADGSVCDGAVICIKEVLVGDITLKNIEASVVKNQKAPLLLGQSILERFGKITIDNDSSTLIIKH